jgi:hypothetical protein
MKTPWTGRVDDGYARHVQTQTLLGCGGEVVCQVRSIGKFESAAGCVLVQFLSLLIPSYLVACIPLPLKAAIIKLRLIVPQNLARD